MKQRQIMYQQQVALSQRIKYFLSTFKVHPCTKNYSHAYQYCQDYHNQQDIRRNPYLEHSFLYYPHQYGNFNHSDSKYSQNSLEMYYHPLLYKTNNCPNYNCNIGFICTYLHDRQPELLSKYQFFRFDLDTFKTQICPHRDQLALGHQLASCRFYHNDNDKRRNPKLIQYCHVQCPNQCKDPKCTYSHNKIQQLYHISRYKTKYCQSFVNKKSCQYHEFCSFAHSDEEITIQLLHLLPNNQHFLDYKYKTVWCPYTNQHDRSLCPYAHNFQDYRRDPLCFKYSSQLCTYWTKGNIKSIQDSGCPLQMNCPKSHGWLQSKYHPQKDNQANSPSSSQKSSKQKKQTIDVFGFGAPFFQSQVKVQRQKSQPKKQNSSLTKQFQNQFKQDKSKGFKFSICIPTESQQWNQNDQDYKNFQKQYVLILQSPQLEQKNETKNKQIKKYSLDKSKRTKKSKVQYSKSLKQLLHTVGLDQKVQSVHLTQIKLVGMTDNQISKLQTLNQQQKNTLKIIVKQYLEDHKLNKIEYSKSMIHIFKRKAFPTILEKMKKKGVHQRQLQNLSPSLIQQISFLEEKQKKQLPKILQQYADDRAFRQLNSQISKHTKQVIQNKQSTRRKAGSQNFKT